MSDELRVNLIRAQLKMLSLDNKHRRGDAVTVLISEAGDKVFLKLRYKQKSLTERIGNKLAPRFHGPSTVMVTIGVVAYSLDLPNHCKTKSIFHDSTWKFYNTITSQFPSFDLENQVWVAGNDVTHNTLDSTSSPLRV